jgi:hypothetical protein
MNHRNDERPLDEPLEDDGFRTEYPPLEGYPPGHYKSWNGDIPDVEQPE